VVSIVGTVRRKSFLLALLPTLCFRFPRASPLALAGTAALRRALSDERSAPTAADAAPDKPPRRDNSRNIVHVIIKSALCHGPAAGREGGGVGEIERESISATIRDVVSRNDVERENYLESARSTHRGRFSRRAAINWK